MPSSAGPCVGRRWLPVGADEEPAARQAGHVGVGHGAAAPAFRAAAPRSGCGRCRPANRPFLPPARAVSASEMARTTPKQKPDLSSISIRKSFTVPFARLVYLFIRSNSVMNHAICSLDRHAAVVEHDGVVGLAQRRYGTAHVGLVALADVALDLLQRHIVCPWPAARRSGGRPAPWGRPS